MVYYKFYGLLLPCGVISIFYLLYLNLVAIVLDISRTCTGLVPTVPVLGQNTIFMGTQERLQMLVKGQSRLPRVRQLDFASRGPKINERLF